MQNNLYLKNPGAYAMSLTNVMRNIEVLHLQTNLERTLISASQFRRKCLELKSFVYVF